MDLLHQLFWYHGKLLNIEWSVWKVIGWIGNVIFSSRFVVQWHATEKKKEVVVPALFWWLSLTGSLTLLAYGLSQRDSVFIFAYLFTWLPYIRNLVIHYRHERACRVCAECGTRSSATANFCAQCGTPLVETAKS